MKFAKMQVKSYKINPKIMPISHAFQKGKVQSTGACHLIYCLTFLVNANEVFTYLQKMQVKPTKSTLKSKRKVATNSKM